MGQKTCNISLIRLGLFTRNYSCAMAEGPFEARIRLLNMLALYGLNIKMG